MSKFKLPLLLVMLAAISMPAVAGDKVVKRVPQGAVAFHFVFDLSYETGEFVGYIAFIEGVDGPLFTGPASEDTAKFTLRVTKPLPFPPLGFPNGLPVPDDNLTTLVYPPGGQFTVYYSSSPGSREWDDPDTFSEGIPIAVFDESALLSTIADGAFPGVFYNVFSSRLVDGSPIKFDGQRINFRRLVPNGVTVTNFGNGVRFSPGPGASGGGTAIAIGGKFRHMPDDD